MIKVKNIKLLGILLAILVIFLGIRSLFTQTITNDSIASAIILVLIGIAYIVIVAKPQWVKAVFFFEGIIIGICYLLFHITICLELLDLLLL